jgi:hypothetical protein
MDWMKQILQVIQAGLSVYANGQFIKKSGENAKAVALQSTAVAFGVVTFLILFTASLIMVFVDLGIQIESQNGVHFSGMMWSASGLTIMGLMILIAGCSVAKYLSIQEQKKKKISQMETSPYTPLILFGEELLKQLMIHLNKNEDPSNPESKD